MEASELKQFVWRWQNGVVAVILFLTCWFHYGLFLREADLEAYNLQQMGVDSLVAHGTFEVGKSTHPRLIPGGDVFAYRGRLLAAKQPGQFALGALAYVPLRAFGVNYDKDYVLTSAWVTWLSSTSFAALTVALSFVLVTAVWRRPLPLGLAVAAILGLGTPIWAYSGVAHHDVISGGFVLAMFVMIEIARKPGVERALLAWFAAGFFGGVALFVSMLPALIVLTLLSYSALYCGRRGFLAKSLGFMLGVLPLAMYNWHYFGSPFLQANVAGGYGDTFFRPTIANFLAHLKTYLGFGELSLWLYAPIAGVGILLLPLLLKVKVTRPAAGAMLCALTIHFAYILNIETIGHCQFGPRYLLPAFPFMALGLIGAYDLKGRMRWLIAGTLGLLIFPFSVFAARAGALFGTMNCDLSRYLVLRAPLTIEASASSLTDGFFPWMTAGLMLSLGLASALIFVRGRILYKSYLDGDYVN